MTDSLAPLRQLTLIQTWNRLTTTRKIGVAALVAAAIAGLLFFVSWSRTPEYVAAFTDLSAEDAAAIVEYLKEQNIPYEIPSSNTIRVPAGRVHEVRLALAGKGLPNKGNVGFELFDSTNLGMTDFVQQVNYQRALEGELARTIGSLTAVQSARVHIVIPQPALFTEDEQPATASVVIGLKPGQTLSREQVRAISHLVSSSVEGLKPENVTIVDTDGNVLTNGSESQAMASVTLSATQLEAQQAFERNLELRIKSMLDNVLGPDRAVVRVAATMNWDQVETEKETYLPAEEGSVVRSSRTISEAYGADATLAAGVPGADSNIAGAIPSYQSVLSGTNALPYARFDNTTNYEVSRNTSKVISATGRLERLSVSVLVDNITDTVTLGAIREATIAAAGIDGARGDVLTVSSVPFDRGFYAEQEAAMKAAQQREFYLRLAQWGAIALVLAALFLVVRGIQRNLRAYHPPAVATLPQVDARALLLQEVNRITAGEQESGVSVELRSPSLPRVEATPEQAAERAQMLRQLQIIARTKPESLAQIIQFWMSDEGGQS